MPALLDRLTAAGCRPGVLANGLPEWGTGRPDTHGLTARFDEVYTSCEAGAHEARDAGWNGRGYGPGPSRSWTALALLDGEVAVAAPLTERTPAVGTHLPTGADPPAWTSRTRADARARSSSPSPTWWSPARRSSGR